MKLVINFNGTNILLDPDKLEALADILETGQVLENKYIGSGLGTNGTNYMELIASMKIHEVLKPGVMTTTSYDALVFITKQLEAKDKK